MNEITDLRLGPDSDLATRYETPHGVLRTLLHPAAEGTKGKIARLAIRYHDQRLVMALVLGHHAVSLADLSMSWLWEQFPSPQTDASAFLELVTDFLQGDARQVDEGADVHSIVLAAISREDETGSVWLSWLGTGGVRALDIEREPLPIAKGLVAGEGWSPQHGVIPEHAQSHTEVMAINAIDRLLIFTNVLRPAIDEIPHLGRATLQRVAEAHAQNWPAVVFDLAPYRVVPSPEHTVLRYRWEDPFEATLFWSASKNATGYRVEQSSSLSFEDASTLADLADARQRVYRVQPPVGDEIYYRVVPFDKDIAGPPSTPVVVTPVPLVSPVIEAIEWLDNGSFRIMWSSLPQANWYELEASPEADFDSPQTAIIYRGEEASFETATNVATGWYYRVRSLNTYYAPKSPSPWSQARRAPERLEIPAFVQVSTSQIAWTPIAGAKLYQVQHVSMVDGKPQIEIAGISENPFFNPKAAGVYHVRALRAADDEATSSMWSQGVTIGYSEDVMSAETAKIPVLDNTKTATLPRAAAQAVDQKRDTIETEAVSLDDEDEQVPASMLWRIVLITAAVAVGLGLIVGLIGGPRLGIGMDDTPTPIPRADRDATATQAYVFVEQATERAELHQVVGLATEIRRDLSTKTHQNERLSAQVANQQATATQNAADLVFMQSRRDVAETQVAFLEQTAVQFATEAASTTAANAQHIGTLTALGGADEQEIDSLNAALMNADAEINSLDATLTYYNEAIATLDADVQTNETAVAALQASATAQTQAIETLKEQADQYVLTITALAPTLTPIPTPTLVPTATPLASWLGG